MVLSQVTRELYRGEQLNLPAILVYAKTVHGKRRAAEIDYGPETRSSPVQLVLPSAPMASSTCQTVLGSTARGS